MLLAHGAGSDMHGAALAAVADALAAAKIPSLRFNYPYRSAGRKAPDRPRCSRPRRARPRPSWRRGPKLPPERLVLGGRSMGGRYCSLVVGDDDDPVPASGCCCSSTRCTPAGKPEQPPHRALPAAHGAGAVRERHPRLAGRAGRRSPQAAEGHAGQVTFHWIDTADHGYRPLKASGRTTDDVLAEVAETSVGWVARLPG